MAAAGVSDWDAARTLVMRHGWNATAYQILNHDMKYWFSSHGDAVAGFVRFGRCWVVAGAPVCDPRRLSEVTAELEAHANACGERVLFFGAGSRLAEVYSERSNHSLLRLGAQPVWEPEGWPAIIRGKASLRAQLNRALNKSVRVEEWPAARARESEELRAVLDDWLGTRGLPPLGFLVTPDLLDNLDDRRVFVASRDESVVAFLIATPIPARGGWLIEQWPRARAAPNGTVHLLVDAAMRAFAEQGSRYATLGLAPLSDRSGEVALGHPPVLRFLLHWARAHGRRFYNFRGLESFKAGMLPMAWEPVYAIADGSRFTLAQLRAVAGAFSAGAPERLVVRALASAAGRELRHLGRRGAPAPIPRAR